jgi:hypothetical protein
LTASWLAASADGVRAGGRGSGAGAGHRQGGGGQEGSPGIGDGGAGRGHQPGDDNVRVRPMFERESERRGRQHAGATGRPGRGGARGGTGCRGGSGVEELTGGR